MIHFPAAQITCTAWLPIAVSFLPAGWPVSLASAAD